MTGQSVPQPVTERLIEAAARALWATYMGESWEHRLKEFPASADLAKAKHNAARVVAAVLPLIADEIEAQTRGYVTEEAIGMLKAAALVRGLAEQLGDDR